MAHEALYNLVFKYLSEFISYNSASLHSTLSVLASFLVVEPANLWPASLCQECSSPESFTVSFLTSSGLYLNFTFSFFFPINTKISTHSLSQNITIHLPSFIYLFSYILLCSIYHHVTHYIWGSHTYETCTYVFMSHPPPTRLEFHEDRFSVLFTALSLIHRAVPGL